MKILPSPIRLQIQVESLESFRAMVVQAIAKLDSIVPTIDRSLWEQAALADAHKLYAEVQELIEDEKRITEMAAAV